MTQKQENSSLFTDKKISSLFLTMDIDKCLAISTINTKKCWIQEGEAWSKIKTDANNYGGKKWYKTLANVHYLYGKDGRQGSTQYSMITKWEKKSERE